MKKILIAGATGLIGKEITNSLSKRGYRVAVLTREKERAEKIFGARITAYNWDVNKPLSQQRNNWSSEIHNFDAVINLAGENLLGRWNARKKREILSSRINSTMLLYEAVKESSSKPEVFVGASAIGYYGSRGDEILYENSDCGVGFLSETVQKWESAQSKFNAVGCRRVTIRIGVVLSKEGGALKKMLPPFKLFIGGSIGKGSQWVSWIHIKDLTEVFVSAIENVRYSGAINASAPNPVRMKTFAEALGNALKRPALLDVPQFALKLIMGESAEVALASIRALPGVLLNNNFLFSFTDINEALKDLLRK